MKTLLPPFVHAYPAPAILVGCGTVEKPNLITCAWFGTVCSDPPMVGLAVRESRCSYELIREYREFSVNIPHDSDLRAVQFCGAVSGRTNRKFTELGLTPVACPPLRSAPMIDEFSLALACRVKHDLHLGSHDLFIAEIVAVHGHEQPDHPLHRPQLDPEHQMVYLDGRYWNLQAIPE